MKTSSGWSKSLIDLKQRACAIGRESRDEGYRGIDTSTLADGRRRGHSSPIILVAGTDISHGRGDASHYEQLHAELSKLGPTLLVHRGTFRFVGGAMNSGSELRTLKDVWKTFVYHALLSLWLMTHCSTESVVYCHDWSVALVAIVSRALKQYHVIYEANGLATLQMPMVSHGLVPRFAAVLERHVFSRADGLVAVTSRLAETVSGRFHREVTVITNGGNPNQPRIPKLAARRSYNLPPTTGLVGFIGSLTKWQGLELLLRAFRIVANQIEDSRLIIVGDGSERDKLESVSKTLGLEPKIEFLGHLSHRDCLNMIRAFDVAVVPYQHPELYEKIGRSPIKAYEYMAGECPIVSGRFPGLGDEIEGVGCGLVVDAENEGALAQGVIQLLRDPVLREEMGQAGLSFIIRQRSWSDIALKVERECARFEGRRRGKKERHVRKGGGKIN